jgi:hypothetical protein
MKIKPLVERFSSTYWKTEITRAEERSKKFIEMAEESIRVYNAQKQVGILNDTERRLNVWWYCVNTLLPAYYSSTPKAEVSLRKRTGGTLEELSAVILERNIQYVMDCEFPFDTVGYNAALQFLLTGRAVLWARYEAEIEEEEMEIALFPAGDGSLLDDQGQPFTQEIASQREGPGGLIIAKVKIEKKESEDACLDVVQYNDYHCSDGRNETEVEWRSRRAYLTRPQAEELFGAEVADKMHFDSFPDKATKDWNRDSDKYEGKAEVHEIWCEETERVYWGHKSAEKFIIHESEPPIDFEGFYPCSVIAQSADPDSVLPVSDYAHVKDQILEIERLTTRIHAVTQTIRTNALYDASLGLQVEQLMIGDLKMVPVMNWPSYKSRGGLQAGIEFMDIGPYVNALQQLQGARQTALQQLYETLKVSDLLRGTSEQYKSATANRLESQWSSLGLVVRQNMFCKFISDAIAKLGTIIAEQFEPETIFEVGDADRMIEAVLPPMPEASPMPMGQEGMPPGEPGMEMMPPPMPMGPPIEMQIAMYKDQILGFLRDDDKVNYRIKIASDSMVAIDQAQEQQEGAQLMSTAGEFFNQMRSLIEQYPPLLGFSIELFQNVIKRFKSGKELDGIFTKALNQIGEISKAKEEAAKQPPPPDPAMQEMQVRMQIAQMEAQARIQAVQIQSQDSREKNMLSAQEQQMKMQREQLTGNIQMQKAQLDQYVAEQELALKQQELQIKANSVQVDMLKVQAMTEGQSMKNEIAAENNRLQGLLKVQELEAQQTQFRLSQQEKLIEERRLQQEQQIEQIRMSMEQTKNFNANSSMQPAAKISSKKRRAELINDENGNPVSIKISEEPVDRKLITDENGNLIGMEF